MLHIEPTSNKNNNILKKKIYTTVYDFWEQLSFCVSHFDNPFTYLVISFGLAVMRSAAE